MVAHFIFLPHKTASDELSKKNEKFARQKGLT